MPGMRHGGHEDQHSDHGHMVADFRRRFWVSCALTAPIVALSEMIHSGGGRMI